MATILQLVDDSLNVLFDLNDPNGTVNVHLGGLRTELALGGALDFGVPQEEVTMISSPAIDGGEIIRQHHGLAAVSWHQRIRPPTSATTPDLIISGIGELARLLDERGVIKWVPNNSAEVRYIDYEPSPTPGIFRGLPYELHQITQLLDSPQGIALRVIRQPFLRGAELLPGANLVTNPTLTHDFGGTANRPDDWAWSGTVGLSAETIAQVEVGGVRRGVYRFTKADGTAASLQLTTADNTYASGDVGVFSFYARVTAVAGTPQMRATLQFQTNAAANVGSLHSGTLTTLTTAWQRISVVSTAAGATTGQAQVSIQIDNVDATAVTVEICNAQAEKTAVTGFRVPAAAVNFNPTSTALPRRIAVWGEGNAPSLGKFKVTSDALTLGRYRVYRVTDQAVNILKATLHKSLRSGTLGADTTSTADADGVDGNVALVTYTEPDPAFGTDASIGGVGDTITVPKPASLAVGEFMLAYVYRRISQTFIVAPQGWKVLGSLGATNSVLWVFYKVADASDLVATDYTFTVPNPSGANSYRAWIGRFTNVDPDSPIDDFEFSHEATGSTPTAASLSTSADDAMIVAGYFGDAIAASGTLDFTAPTGTTPTYTERDDGTMDVTWRAGAVYTGVLATAGATGTKDATASQSAAVWMCHVALRKATAVLATRSTVTYTAAQLPPGEYDVWLRYRTTAACRDRIRVEYGTEAVPTAWVSLGDFILDTTGASTFTEYHEHRFGRLRVPDEVTVNTIAIRVSSGREASSSASLRLDMVYLAPATEHVAMVASPSLLTTGEHLESRPADAGVFHLDSGSLLAEIATCDGPPPLTLEPGLNVLVVWPQLLPITGFADPPTEVTAAPTDAVTHSPRYRT